MLIAADRREWSSRSSEAFSGFLRPRQTELHQKILVGAGVSVHKTATRTKLMNQNFSRGLGR